MEYQFLPVDRIIYGIDIVSKQLYSEIDELKAQKVLLVTTNSLLDIEEYQSLIDTLSKRKIDTYQIVVKQHVPGEHLMKNIQEIHQFSPDLIISCGGGSPIDAGKILSLVLSEQIRSEEELYDFSEVNRAKTSTMKNYIPHFAIPTTLSAAEFTHIAGVTNSKDQLKYKFAHFHMVPAKVFLDPLFARHTPEWLWLSTGARALDHAVETLYSPTPNPVNTGLALQALKILHEYLPLSKENPENLDYRLQCQLGAWLSLFSVVNIKLGLSHSIGHQLGALYDIPHGMTSAIMLPAVMEFLLPRTYEQQALIPEILGESDPNKSIEENAAKAPTIIRHLIEKLEIPCRLREFDVPEESIPQLINNILIDIKAEQNPFVIDTKNLNQAIEALIKKVW